jgi:hypothetical protein
LQDQYAALDRHRKPERSGARACFVRLWLDGARLSDGRLMGVTHFTISAP